MARVSFKVSFKPVDANRIPDLLVEGAALIMDLQGRGVVDAVGQRLRIRRQGGYCGLDVWLVLFLFFTTGTTRGIRGFWDEARRHALKLAALAGRLALPSPASLSRALDSVEPELLREASTWLLAGVAEIDRVLVHPAVLAYDARGAGWHVFDLDPTVTTLRQRALPEDDDLPEPRRRAKETGAPGHAGRKRGDIQFRRVTVQHSGSGAWIHGHLSPGNGEGVVDFARALNTVADTCDRLKHPRSQTLVRMDGEYGNVPWYTACRERQLAFITRLNRPNLYDDPEILERLRQATWHRVPDSKAGPQRSAAEIGMLTVHPGKQTRRPDGTAYEPITVRVIASIFPKTGEAKRGRTIDGWQVELFAADVSAAAWPAAEAVAAYFGRTAQENRFAQEDRELGLDRIISYHLPGQELAALVGLSLWNLRLVRGFKLEPPPPARPVQRPRRPLVDDRIPAKWPRDPVIRNTLAELDWTEQLADRPDWTWRDGELRCDQMRVLNLTTVRSAERADGRTSIIFRRPKGGCLDCPSRAVCLRSASPATPKHAEFSVPTEIATRIRARLESIRRSHPPFPGVDGAGPWEVTEALFLPAAARHLYSAAFIGASIRVEVNFPPPALVKPTLLAIDPGHRQCRRKTWEQNVARYALAGDVTVRFEIESGDALREILGAERDLKSAAGDCG